MLDILLTHSIARQENKPPFFFSRFNFARMKERGNTHFCFHCLSRTGFNLDQGGKAVNIAEEDVSLMKHHDNVTHADGVIGNADKYSDPWTWLAKELPSDFPYIVTIPNLS